MSNLFQPAQNQTDYWLNAERLRVYSIIFIAVFLAAAVVWVSLADGMIDRTDKPLGYDFIAFYSASKIALGPDPTAVFDQMTMFRTEHALIPADRGLFPWNYPPQYLLVVLPLSLLPYVASFFTWTLFGFALYLAMIYRFAPSRLTLLVVCAYPAVFWNLTHGQNGLLLAALFGGAMLFLEKRPLLAGILIGLMSFKPHMGLLIPIALICQRQWIPFASAAVTTVLFAVVSTAVFGIDSWAAWWKSLEAIRTYVEIGANPLPRMTSMFTALLLLGVDVALAYAVQIVLALGVAGCVAWVWLRAAAYEMRVAVLVAGTPMVTPYVFDYDLAMQAIPIALIVWDGMRRGWLRGEREILILAWVTPLLATNLAVGTGLHIGYLCMLTLFAIAVRRAFAPAGSLVASEASAIATPHLVGA